MYWDVLAQQGVRGQGVVLVSFECFECKRTGRILYGREIWTDYLRKFEAEEVDMENKVLEFSKALDQIEDVDEFLKMGF